MLRSADNGREMVFFFFRVKLDEILKSAGGYLAGPLIRIRLVRRVIYIMFMVRFDIVSAISVHFDENVYISNVIAIRLFRVERFSLLTCYIFHFFCLTYVISIA